MPAELKAIFFDVGNTLLFPNRQRILGPLFERGVRPSEDHLRAIERQTKQEFDALMQSGAQGPGFWHIFYSHLLQELDLCDDDLRDSLTLATGVSANWCDIRPGTRDILQKLGKRYQTGVISNADGKIADVLARCGIADCFSAITDSGLVGQEKPHPGIFMAALESMRVPAASSLYVGDVYSVDYLGATRAGMQAVLFDVPGAYTETDLPRVGSLQELEVMLLRWLTPEAR